MKLSKQKKKLIASVNKSERDERELVKLMNQAEAVRQGHDNH